jgi:hypothetical protein
MDLTLAADDCGDVSDRGATVSNMSSTEKVLDTVEAAEVLYSTMADVPLHTLTNTQLQVLITHCERLEARAHAVSRRLIGQMISQGPPARFGGKSWAEVLARRLRISQAEAQRRIAEAVYEGPLSTAV